MNSFSKIKFSGTLHMVAAISTGIVPQIFPQLKWYQMLVAYIVAPILAFCNAYGTGLTDWSLVTTYGKLAIFAFGAWTGYLTLASPSGSDFPAPNAAFFRSIEVLGVEGFSLLPKNCLTLCYIFFARAVVVNLIRDLVPKNVSRFIPIPMAMAIPFYVGTYFAIDMFIGTIILFVCQRLDRAKADTFGPAVASGLICDDGIWFLPQSVLSLAKVKPPICMRFLSRRTNDKVDAFLKTLS
ncbi:hypothetical protein GUJ93_ZPchr0004g38978 [Zizania palustris]|uniref:Uncharacterized protein n=1 Tax=Zizania palustris TaxID=103762 RepID=A0A8J5V930_ZIZPA|nr:hypothetical protein GUJ93_ZPchr0004g38978 [Zizania palustris]